MAIKTSRVTVGTNATRLDAQTDADYGTTQDILIVTPVELFIGGPDVTTANGLAIAAGSSISITLPQDSVLYGVVALDTAVVQVMQVGV